MQIVYKKVNELIPYKNNPRINDEAVEYVKNSIKEFGFKVPIVIDKDNVIIAGHTRLKASLELGLKELPCIIADDLSEEQIKAFRLADNKVGEKSQWDFSKLDEELDNILDIDMSLFDFDLDNDIQELNEEFEEDIKENERQRTNNTYNLELFDRFVCDGKYQMPIIDNDNYIPEKLTGFNYAKTSKEKNTGIHFYLDDYQFERIWNNPEEYVDVLQEYDCILSPDFSLYLDMSYSMKIWNVFRSRLIGQYYQRQGIKVIPTLSWAEEETFEFCFDGIPKGSIVSISTIGVKRNNEAMNIWKNGVDEMIKRIEPSAILIYGGKIDYDFKNIRVIYYENEVTERMKKLK